jgi:chromosome segregation ATPase
LRQESEKNETIQSENSSSTNSMMGGDSGGSKFKDPLIALDFTKIQLDGKLNDLVSNLKESMNGSFNELKQRIHNLNQQEEIMRRDIEYLSERISKEQEVIKDLEEELFFYRGEADNTIVQVLKNEVGYQSFLEFCKNENAEHFVLFFTASENFKTGTDNLEKEARELFQTYLSNESLNPIQISPELLQFIQDNLSTPTRNLFVSVQREVLTKLKQGPFKKFENSGIGKAVMKSL